MDENPSKHDLATVFKKLRSIPANKVCFDCGAKNPTWSSVTYGVFICIDCSAIHRGLGVHVSFVRSSTLDTNWAWLQLRAMQVGGNSSAMQFFRQHGCTTSDAQQKYKSRAAQLYREKLHHAAAAAMRLHGTKLMIDNLEQLSPNPTEDKDFFSDEFTPVAAIPRNDSNVSFTKEAFFDDEQPNGDSHGPSVDHLEKADEGKETAAAVAAEPIKKATFGGRKTGPKKAGMGAKKTGFGAQKVRANFSEIEKQAETLDKEREEALAARFKPASASAEPEVAGLSARLMVQDIGKERTKEEERIKQVDPKKVEQVERLGMGFKTAKGGVSHSIASDIVTINQEGTRAKSGLSGVRKPRDIMEDPMDDWEVLNEPPSSGRRNDISDLGGRKNNSSMFDEDDFFTPPTSSSSWDTVDEPRKSSRGTDYSKSSYAGPASDDGALKKFGNAKAISSDQYFGDKADFESRANLSKFDGATGIGSADLFGGDTSRGGGGGNYGPSYGSHMPEVADIKDSVRQGVSKVAGKLSSLSSSVQGYMSVSYYFRR